MARTCDSGALDLVRTLVWRIVLVGLVACGRHPGNGGDDDASVATDGSGGGDAASGGDGPSSDAAHDGSTIDAFPGVLDMHINCHNDCVLIADPASIDVTAGTEFKVNWINTGDTECDVAKIDRFNHVPIILGLEPGMSYLDPVHEWCGQIFTGTFEFEIRICTIPSYIPVNCGA